MKTKAILWGLALLLLAYVSCTVIGAAMEAYVTQMVANLF